MHLNLIIYKEESKTKDKKKNKNKYKNKNTSITQLKNILHFFEIISKSIQEILNNVSNSYSKKKNKSYINCEEEIFIVSEITLCCKLIIDKISTFNFNTTNPELLKRKYIKCDQLYYFRISRYYE